MKRGRKQKKRDLQRLLTHTIQHIERNPLFCLDMREKKKIGLKKGGKKKKKKKGL